MRRLVINTSRFGPGPNIPQRDDGMPWWSIDEDRLPYGWRKMPYGGDEITFENDGEVNTLELNIEYKKGARLPSVYNSPDPYRTNDGRGTIQSYGTEPRKATLLFSFNGNEMNVAENEIVHVPEISISTGTNSADSSMSYSKQGGISDNIIVGDTVKVTVTSPRGEPMEVYMRPLSGGNKQVLSLSRDDSDIAKNKYVYFFTVPEVWDGYIDLFASVAPEKWQKLTIRAERKNGVYVPFESEEVEYIKGIVIGEHAGSTKFDNSYRGEGIRFLNNSARDMVSLSGLINNKKLETFHVKSLTVSQADKSHERDDGYVVGNTSHDRIIFKHMEDDVEVVLTLFQEPLVIIDRTAGTENDNIETFNMEHLKKEGSREYYRLENVDEHYSFNGLTSGNKLNFFYPSAYKEYPGDKRDRFIERGGGQFTARSRVIPYEMVFVDKKDEKVEIVVKAFDTQEITTLPEEKLQELKAKLLGMGFLAGEDDYKYSIPISLRRVPMQNIYDEELSISEIHSVEQFTIGSSSPHETTLYGVATRGFYTRNDELIEPKMTITLIYKKKRMARNITNTIFNPSKVIAELAKKAPLTHTHAIADVTGLEDRLSAVETAAATPNVEVLDVLNSTEAGKALSANQGKALKDLIDGINTTVANHTTLLQSDDVSLDSIQEIVTKIKENKSLLDALTADNLVGLAAKLAAKQDTASLGTDVANAGFIKQTAVDTAIEGLKSNGKIKDDLLPTNIVRYDEQGDITTKQAALTDYEETEVPTSKAVKDAIATAKQEAIAAASGELTKEKVEELFGFKMKMFTLTFNGTTEASANDVFVVEGSQVMSYWFDTKPNSYIEFYTDNGVVSGVALENETVTAKVIVIKEA